MTDEDCRIARQWLRAGHPPTLVATWLECEIADLANLRIPKTGGKIATTPTPATIRVRAAAIRMGWRVEDYLSR